MATYFARKNYKNSNTNKKPLIKHFSGGHGSNEKFPITVPSVSDVWTEDMSHQIRKEKIYLQREQERKRKAAIEAMKLVEQRRAREKENKENLDEVVVKEKPTGENSARRALFTMDVNRMNKVPLKTVCTLPVVKENEDLSFPVSKGRPILGARPFSGPKFKLPADTINRLKDLNINRSAQESSRQTSIIRYEPEELMKLNPFSKEGKFFEFYR